MNSLRARRYIALLVSAASALTQGNAIAQTADEESGLDAHQQPTADFSINPAARSSRHVVAYSDNIGLTVRIQSRHVWGAVDYSDCGDGALDLGAPNGTEALSRPAVAVAAGGGRAAVVVAAYTGASWKFFVKFHDPMSTATCSGWQTSWQSLPTDADVRCSSFAVQGAPSAVYDADGTLVVRASVGSSKLLCESRLSQAGTWSGWSWLAMSLCNSSAGPWLGAPTTVRWNGELVTVGANGGGNRGRLAIILERGVILGIPLITSAGTQGYSSAGCSVSSLDDGIQDRLFAACRFTDGRIYVHAIQLDRLLDFAQNGDYCPSADSYYNSNVTLYWKQLPIGLEGDAGYGHFAVAGYPGLYAVDIETRSLFAAPPFPTPFLRSFGDLGTAFPTYSTLDYIEALR
jgi:hypothetical protein